LVALFAVALDLLYVTKYPSVHEYKISLRYFSM
jgi:hypothetical protein